ncbi:MAG TPA: oxidative damage protection protein [Gemmatimonadales bacterium]|jgi:Fe-S cluster biosynthesis and repair protein YggX
MPSITCARCGMTRDQLPFRPFQNELGLRVFTQICHVCWGDWLKTQQQLINHYGLNVREQQAKDFLFKQMEQFLFPASPPTAESPQPGAGTG